MGIQQQAHGEGALFAHLLIGPALIERVGDGQQPTQRAAAWARAGGDKPQPAGTDGDEHILPAEGLFGESREVGTPRRRYSPIAAAALPAPTWKK